MQQVPPLNTLLIHSREIGGGGGGHRTEDVMAKGYNSALVLHAGPARLSLERNREREPSREEGRENRREGGGGRERRRRIEILRLLTVSTASAAFIRSGDRGRDGESLSDCVIA